ncbi:MAG TPA: hypothetical protein ENN69_06655, partial [Spirochaetia bacterium]|nr:hypothetical protein [Spirochaetia bacterium]
MMKLFQRNMIRIKLLVVVIVTTLLLAVYKTLLGGYLMGLNLQVSALYRTTSMISLTSFSLAGFILFFRILKPFQSFCNLAVHGETVSPELYRKASRVSKTVARFAFAINFFFYTFSSFIMYFLNYYGRLEPFWLGVRYGVFNFTTNFATAFMAALLQVTFIDYLIDKHKKKLRIHFMTNERELKIRTRLLLFSAATIVYMISFIALPAFNKLEAERNIKTAVSHALASDMSKQEIIETYQEKLALDSTR